MRRRPPPLAALVLSQLLMQAASLSAGSLTDVAGIKVGQYTLEERPTGCTVVLIEQGAVGGVEQAGGAPGSREIALLDPMNTVDRVHAVVLAGGSAFGLDAASGTMRYLEEKGFGWPAGPTKVPIVVSAILFDLGVGGKPEIRPTADCGYRAAQAANTGAVAEGSIGAGAGATVGKLRGPGFLMKGGLGTASHRLPDGLVVAALVAVNAVGDIVDPTTGQVIAGVRADDGRTLADARRLVREGKVGTRPRSAENTTIAVVATNARLSKAEAGRMALMASDGMSRAIDPAHTPGDGDTVFSLATGTWEGDVNLTVIGSLAAEVLARAIVRGVEQAEGLPGIPSIRDLEAQGAAH